MSTQDYHSKMAKQEPFIIQDWAGNLMPFGRFKTFEDAEEFLCEHLDENYEELRQEFYIMQDTRTC